MHHICAYSASQNPGANVEVDVPAVTDTSLTIQNGHFLPQRPVSVIFWGGASPTATKQRLSTPTINVITSPFLRDLNAGASMGNPQQFADYSHNPFALAALEEVAVLHTHSAAVAEQNAAFLGLMIQQAPAPAGNVFTIRGTAAATLVPFAWTNINPITFQNQLPTGIYSVVGATFQSAGAMAGRCILENWPWRPGAFGQLAATNRTDRLFRMGNLGEWGRFHNYAMPQIEMFSATADVLEEITLDLVKVG